MTESSAIPQPLVEWVEVEQFGPLRALWKYREGLAVIERLERDGWIEVWRYEGGSADTMARREFARILESDRRAAEAEREVAPEPDSFLSRCARAWEVLTRG